MENSKLTLSELVQYLEYIGCPPIVLEGWYTALKNKKKLKISNTLPSTVTCYLQFDTSTFYYVE